MKVLWFSNSPCGSIRREMNEAISGGWLISLETEIKKQNEIQLEVAFFSNKEEAAFDFDGVRYYPMYLSQSSNALIRAFERYKSLSKVDFDMLPIMLDVIKLCKPDLIHIHGTEERFGLIADSIKDIPIVFSIQGMLAPYLEKYFSGMPREAVVRYESWYDRMRNVSFEDDFKSMQYRAKREVKFLTNAQYIFGRTFWDKDITSMLNMKRKYYEINEILRAPFYNKKWEKTSFSVKLKLVSTISGGIYKGYETVLRTAKLLKEYALFDFEWIIVGYDDKNKWSRIGSKITGIKPRDCNIRLIGRIGAEELSNLLITSDLYCHTSHIENSPNSVCEAMLLGLPIIATYAGGTGSLLDNGKEGLLVQDGDPFVAAGAIVKLYHNFEFAKQLGENAKIRAFVRHNPQRIASQLVDAYGQIKFLNNIFITNS